MKHHRDTSCSLRTQGLLCAGLVHSWSVSLQSRAGCAFALVRGSQTVHLGTYLVSHRSNMWAACWDWTGPNPPSLQRCRRLWRRWAPTRARETRHSRGLRVRARCSPGTIPPRSLAESVLGGEGAERQPEPCPSSTSPQALISPTEQWGCLLRHHTQQGGPNETWNAAAE